MTDVSRSNNYPSEIFQQQKKALENTRAVQTTQTEQKQKIDSLRSNIFFMKKELKSEHKTLTKGQIKILNQTKIESKNLKKELKKLQFEASLLDKNASEMQKTSKLIGKITTNTNDLSSQHSTHSNQAFMRHNFKQVNRLSQRIEKEKEHIDGLQSNADQKISHLTMQFQKLQKNSQQKMVIAINVHKEEASVKSSLKRLEAESKKRKSNPELDEKMTLLKAQHKELRSFRHTVAHMESNAAQEKLEAFSKNTHLLMGEITDLLNNEKKHPSLINQLINLVKRTPSSLEKVEVSEPKTKDQIYQEFKESLTPFLELHENGSFLRGTGKLYYLAVRFYENQENISPKDLADLSPKDQKDIQALWQLCKNQPNLFNDYLWELTATDDQKDPV